MLGAQKLTAFVATTDPERAKSFYRDVLGLRLVDENPFAVVFEVSGTMVRVTTVQNVQPQAYTVLGVEVSDILAATKELKRSGVELKRYPELAQDEHGYWTAPGGAKVAWFEDPDGNVLSVAQP